jgi:UrcA family protein
MLKISGFKISALAACLFCAAAAPAFAQDAADDVQLKVSYADLDLTAQAGLSVLDHRIAIAVKQVCGDADMRNVVEWKAMKACRNQAQQTAQSTRDAALASVRSQRDHQVVVVAAK